ncbi:MAG: hypothetical protein IPN53_24035 [Comamonadaceae bacterium]|nr:hypothetical protein [Comamonadaceae bacterium]
MVIDLGQPLGFVLDRVASVVGVEASKIEGVRHQRHRHHRAADRPDHDIGGHAMVMVLNSEKLIAQEFAQIAAISRAQGTVTAKGMVSAKADDTVRAIDAELHLVSFDGRPRVRHCH